MYISQYLCHLCCPIFLWFSHTQHTGWTYSEKEKKINIILHIRIFCVTTYFLFWWLCEWEGKFKWSKDTQPFRSHVFSSLHTTPNLSHLTPDDTAVVCRLNCDWWKWELSGLHPTPGGQLHRSYNFYGYKVGLFGCKYTSTRSHLQIELCRS